MHELQTDPSTNRTRQDRSLSVLEAAAVLGITLDAVRKRIARGQVRAYRTGGR